jgi:enolase
MAVSKAGAAEKDVPLYKHIADLAGGADARAHTCRTRLVLARGVVT